VCWGWPSRVRAMRREDGRHAHARTAWVQKIPLPGRNGLSDRVCEGCDNSCHNDRRGGSAGERRTGASPSSPTRATGATHEETPADGRGPSRPADHHAGVVARDALGHRHRALLDEVLEVPDEHDLVRGLGPGAGVLHLEAPAPRPAGGVVAEAHQLLVGHLRLRVAADGQVARCGEHARDQAVGPADGLGDPHRVRLQPRAPCRRDRRPPFGAGALDGREAAALERRCADLAADLRRAVDGRAAVPDPLERRDLLLAQRVCLPAHASPHATA
jgi:hypothetical protein